MPLRRLAVFILLPGFFLVQAHNSAAQCFFDRPLKAKGGKWAAQRFYQPCEATTVYTSGNEPGCEPITPYDTPGDGPTAYRFGAAGKCSWKIQYKLVKDCSALEDNSGNPLDLPAGPGGVFFVKAKCRNILQSDGQTPIGPPDDGWTLRLLYRSTTNGLTGDVTAVDFPTSFPFNEPDNGGLTLSRSSAEVRKNLVGATGACFPPCTTISIVDAVIVDPSGRFFAARGGMEP